VVGCAANGRGRRGWKVVQAGAEFLDTVVDARGVAFLDLDEDVSGELSLYVDNAMVVDLWVCRGRWI
jgi:hypothetical protein